MSEGEEGVRDTEYQGANAGETEDREPKKGEDLKERRITFQRGKKNHC